MLRRKPSFVLAKRRAAFSDALVKEPSDPVARAKFAAMLSCPTTSLCPIPHDIGLAHCVRTEKVIDVNVEGMCVVDLSPETRGWFVLDVRNACPKRGDWSSQLNEHTCVRSTDTEAVLSRRNLPRIPDINIYRFVMRSVMMMKRRRMIIQELPHHHKRQRWPVAINGHVTSEPTQNLPSTYPAPIQYLLSTYETRHYKKGIIVTLIIFCKKPCYLSISVDAKNHLEIGAPSPAACAQASHRTTCHKGQLPGYSVREFRIRQLLYEALNDR